MLPVQERPAVWTAAVQPRLTQGSCIRSRMIADAATSQPWQVAHVQQHACAPGQLGLFCRSTATHGTPVCLTLTHGSTTAGAARVPSNHRSLVELGVLSC